MVFLSVRFTGFTVIPSRKATFVIFRQHVFNVFLYCYLFEMKKISVIMKKIKCDDMV